MKTDRLITLLGIVAVFSGIPMMLTGKSLMGLLMFMLGAVVFMNRGTRSYNERSVYEKVVKTDISTEELFEKLKETETALGRAWIAGHKDFDGDCIIFGPDMFRDCVIAGRKGRSLTIRHSTQLDRIIRKSEDEYRFEKLRDVSGLEVTAERYASFASLNLSSAMLVKSLYEYVLELGHDADAVMPDDTGNFRMYYHNSHHGHFSDSKGDDILAVRNSRDPFEARVFDEDGSEMASVMPHSFNPKGEVIDSAGYEFLANGEHYGEVKRYKAGKKEGFMAETDDGIFTINIFPACVRANISCNYTIEREGKLMAVIGGSPNLLFDKYGKCQSDIILSYDDDYLVLYAALEIFIMTLNRRFLK